MPCFRPLEAWRTPGGDPIISFGRGHYFDDGRFAIKLPCGQCIGCRLERSRRWAVRLMHEASLHERNSFLTLTYDDAHVPSDGSLRVRDFQLFMKRLRRGSSAPLRFFHCGEYGDENLRPHYHAILFGEDFSADRILHKKTASGDRLYESRRLSEVWENGFALVGDVTFESAAYVARYCLKKVTGDRAEAHYQGRAPEYVTMSRRPGIGAGWFEKWKGEVFPSDSVVMRGRAMLPPPFYEKLLEKVDADLFARVKRERKREMKEVPFNWRVDFGVETDPDMIPSYLESPNGRLLVEEYVKSQTVSNCLKRKL